MLCARLTRCCGLVDGRNEVKKVPMLGMAGAKKRGTKTAPSVRCGMMTGLMLQLSRSY
jgi:hypothetical protein